ncbi:unnamed protein product [Rhizoctonia solani]|uniref:SMODS and SLOG-associating 2TM effector domain-containing protein n=1 Tax=Rhizoctonia solani TaxID=456999 RepID=A0A8H3BHV9_9AGAM|nr:unnamed protein product [Rhizoctonia solani]
MNHSTNTPVVLITGCSRGGIGHSLCEAFAARGCKVYASSRGLESAFVNTSIRPLVMDVTSDESVRKAVEYVIREAGRVDVVVANAGPVLDIPIKYATLAMDTNVLGVLRLAQATLPHMASRKQGIFVTVGSVVGHTTTPWSGVYAASKAAMHAITETLQMEARALSPNIHVMLVVPAGIKSNIADNSTFQLPETSLYKAYLPSIAARLRVSQQPGASMPTATFANAVVQATLRKGGPPREFTYGAQTRYIWFNINALQELAANTVGASYCTTMAKTHEGSYNKIFHLKFDNNQELIAKIPTKLIPPFYTTASEVATMDYARNVLKIQVPEVLAYSAHADSTPVGTEFILMRPGSGTELRKRWDLISEVDAKSVIDQVLNAESQFTKHHFSQIGSIYYKEDVEPSLRKLPLYRDGSGSEPGADKFRIGPSTEWVLWRGARADLEVDRGPWPDVKLYIVAIVRIHQAWLSSCARPHRVQVPPRSAKDLDPQAHKHILDKLVSFFSKVQVPPDLCVNVLWHKDLHARNILIGNSSPPSIQLIDWQSASVGPLFQQATFAMFAQYHGDSRIELLNGVRLPANFDSLPWHERIYLKHQRKIALRHLYYYSGIDPNSQDAQQWSRNVHLRSAIDEAGRTWDLDAGELADSSLDDYDHTRIQIYQDKVAQLYRELELEGDGWVSKECYDDVYVLNQERQETWDEVVAGGPYPIMNGAPSCLHPTEHYVHPRWFITWKSKGHDSNDPERAALLEPSPDQIKLTMVAAEKHRESHHRQAKILEYTLQTLVILQIINGAIISAISATHWGAGVPTVILGAAASILGGVIAAFKSNKTQQREQLAYFALDTFIRKWHDWAYDLDRYNNIRWDDRREELNESNFNSAYDQIQSSEANLVNFAYAVAANAPILGVPMSPIGLGGIGGSPMLTPPRKAPAPLPVVNPIIK